MITLTAQFELLRRARRLALAIQCAGHDWTDEHVEAGKRLRRGDVQCRHCRVIVPLQSAFFYENGVRHGREETLRGGGSATAAAPGRGPSGAPPGAERAGSGHEPPVGRREPGTAGATHL